LLVSHSTHVIKEEQFKQPVKLQS